MKTYKGIKYLIKQNPRMYFWLAYVRLPDNHKWTQKISYDDIPIDCHGGLTFKDSFDGNEKPEENWWGFTKGTWVGWDYGHAGDFVSYGENPLIFANDKKWEYEEVEEEVKNVIKQVLENV